MSARIPRRTVLKLTGTAMLGGHFTIKASRSGGAEPAAGSSGAVIGEPSAAAAGARILAEGGNAVDAIVAAALVAAVAAPHQTGIGGYGASGIFAVDGGTRIIALDANSAAPAAMSKDTFDPDSDGRVPGRRNEIGWLAAGVPGILAGLQMALDRLGTRPFREIVQPAIAIARRGFPWPASLAGLIANDPQFSRDPGVRQIYFRDGKPLAAGAIYTNPYVADLLETLARANSVGAFYRGDIAERIADAFQQHGGLVTAADMAAYQARLIEPLTMTWGGQTIHTPPLTAGGLTTLQALLAMQAMDWDRMPAGLTRTHARVEALRLAWRDRLTLLGDPGHGPVPVAKLLSPDSARESARSIEAAVRAGKPIAHPDRSNGQGGTISLSAGDRHGNLAALTLTHGQGFGARVTVEGLGLTLGHGMSRFDPHPSHPNAPGPGKRPLHNMVPVIVTRDGRAVLAVGGRGGRKIPNAMHELLTQFVALGRPLAESIAAPRLHTEGNTTLEFEKPWPASETAAMAAMGYTIKTASSAVLSAVAIEGGEVRPAMR